MSVISGEKNGMRINLLFLYIISAFATWLDLFFVKSDIIKKYYFAVLLFVALCIGYSIFPYSPDYVGYLSYYYAADNDFGFLNINDDSIDYGFLFLFSFLKIFGLEMECIYIIITVLVCYLYYKILTNHTRYYMVALVFLLTRQFELQNIIQIRQGLACAIVLYSLKFVLNRKIKKFLLTVVIASLIHKMVLVSLLIYPISFIKWNKKKCILISLCSLIIYFVPITEMLLQYFLSLDIGTLKILQYAGTNESIEISGIQMIVNMISLTGGMMILASMKQGERNNVYITMMAIGLFITCAFSDFFILSNRLSLVFRLVLIFVPCAILEKIQDFKMKVIIISIIMIFGLVLGYRSYIAYSSLY